MLWAELSGRRSALGTPVGEKDLAEPIERFGAGRVVPEGDLDALTDAVRSVLADPAAARGGAERARAELTWDAAAAAHVALYRELS